MNACTAKYKWMWTERLQVEGTCNLILYALSPCVQRTVPVGWTCPSVRRGWWLITSQSWTSPWQLSGVELSTARVFPLMTVLLSDRQGSWLQLRRKSPWPHGKTLPLDQNSKFPVVAASESTLRKVKQTNKQKNASKLEHHKSGTLCVFQGYASWLESHCVHLCLGTGSVRKASQEQQKASTSEKSLYFHRAVNLTLPEPRGLAMLLTQHKGRRESNRTRRIHSRAPKGWFGLPRFPGSFL